MPSPTGTGTWHLAHATFEWTSSSGNLLFLWSNRRFLKVPASRWHEAQFTAWVGPNCPAWGSEWHDWQEVPDARPSVRPFASGTALRPWHRAHSRPEWAPFRANPVQTA